MKNFFISFFLIIPFVVVGQFKASVDVIGGIEYSSRVLFTNDALGKLIADTRMNE